MKWAFLLWFMLCSPVYAAPVSTIQASYQVFMSGMQVGEMVETYSRTDDRYTLTSTTTPQGLMAIFKPGNIVAASQGLVDKNGLRPLHFEQKKQGDASRDSHAEFDWDAQQLTLTGQQLPLPEGTQDRLSAMYQFMFLTLENVSSLDFPMTNGNKLDNYHYAPGEHKKLTTPAGRFDTVYLDSQGKPGESRTEIWLDTRHHLPCKMIITDHRGDQITQILSRLKITP